MTQIGILGGGAWGTALGAAFAQGGHNPLLWARDGATVDAINTTNSNPFYLPGIPLPEGLVATENLHALLSADMLLLVTPAQSLRGLLDAMRADLPASTRLILCAKGIETQTGLRVSEVVRAVLPDQPLAVLSGPSFAHDVARGLPTALTLAADTLDAASGLARRYSSKLLRMYASDDVTGVEMGGALKNVIALAIGMVRARGLGASAEAALTTRGFAEILRIAEHFGARAETLTGLSGLGDLILTCSSPQSRNFAYGFAVGEGRGLSGMKLAEGVYTTKIAAKLCKEHGLHSPIIEAIDDVLSERIDIKQAIERLLSRPVKAELE